TYGEGYHNFHHKFPADYRNGIKSYHWDPTKWLIKALSYLGLTNTLRKISDDKILMARLRMEEKRLVRRLALGETLTPHVSQELVVSARLKFERAYMRFHELKGQYDQLRKEKIQV